MKKTIIFLLLVLTACGQSPTALPADAYEQEFERAVQQAKDTFPDFVERFQNPRGARTFAAIKIRFENPDQTFEDIWMDTLTYEAGIFTGAVGDDLPQLRLQFGERIPVPLEDMLDWMIVEDGKLIGGYTIKLTYRYMSEEEKRRFLESIDYRLQ